MKTYDLNDSMPAGYKEALIDLLSFQADSEFAGGQRVAENMRFAPRPEEAFRLAKKGYGGDGAWLVLLGDFGTSWS